MRLIDADALKIDIDNLLLFKKWVREEIKAHIDNTPTVPLPDFKEGYKQAIRDGKTNFSRPQGEWILTLFYGRTCFECSGCHLHYDCMFNYCPNCGAELGKGGAE